MREKGWEGRGRMHTRETLILVPLWFRYSISGMARVRLADLNGSKWTSSGQNGPKWTILVHFGLANAKIRFEIRSFWPKWSPFWSSTLSNSTVATLVSHYSAIGDTISCDAPYSAIGFRGKFFLQYPLARSVFGLRSAIFKERSGGVAAIVCDTTGNTVRQGYCYTCLAIGGGVSVRSLRRPLPTLVAFQQTHNQQTHTWLNPPNRNPQAAIAELGLPGGRKSQKIAGHKATKL